VFEYAIKGQEGRRFWGEIKSGDRTEPLAGAISLDGKRAYGADTDGHFYFTVLSAMSLSFVTRKPRSARRIRSSRPVS